MTPVEGYRLRRHSAGGRVPAFRVGCSVSGPARTSMPSPRAGVGVSTSTLTEIGAVDDDPDNHEEGADAVSDHYALPEWSCMRPTSNKPENEPDHEGVENELPEKFSRRCSTVGRCSAEHIPHSVPSRHTRQGEAPGAHDGSTSLCGMFVSLVVPVPSVFITYSS